MGRTQWKKPPFVMAAPNHTLLDETDGYNLKDVADPKTGDVFSVTGCETWVSPTLLEKMVDAAPVVQQALARLHKAGYRDKADSKIARSAVEKELQEVFDNAVLQAIVARYDANAKLIVDYFVAKYAARAANVEYYAEMEADRKEMADHRAHRGSGLNFKSKP
jgi:hypothetical protein